MLVAEVTELLQCRKVLETAQTEELQEERACPIDERPAGLVFAAEDFHQTALGQHLERRAGVDAADIIDLGPGERLAIGDDGQCFELCAAESKGLRCNEGLHEIGAFARRAKLVAAGDEIEVHAAMCVVRHELIEQRLDLGEGRPRGPGQPFRRHRAARHEDQALEHVLERLRALGDGCPRAVFRSTVVGLQVCLGHGSCSSSFHAYAPEVPAGTTTDSRRSSPVSTGVSWSGASARSLLGSASSAATIASPDASSSVYSR